MARGRVAAAFQKFIVAMQDHEDRIVALEKNLLRAIRAISRNRGK